MKVESWRRSSRALGTWHVAQTLTLTLTLTQCSSRALFAFVW